MTSSPCLSLLQTSWQHHWKSGLLPPIVSLPVRNLVHSGPHPAQVRLCRTLSCSHAHSFYSSPSERGRGRAGARARPGSGGQKPERAARGGDITQVAGENCGAETSGGGDREEVGGVWAPASKADGVAFCAGIAAEGGRACRWFFNLQTVLQFAN